MRKLNTKALKRSFWGAAGRVIGIIIAGGGGGLLHELLGNTVFSYGVAVGMILTGFFLTWIAEYEREVD